MSRSPAYPARTYLPGYARRHVLYPFAWRTGVLVVPGLHNSGPGHWQSRWQQGYLGLTRVRQVDWACPDLEAWSERVALAAQEQPAPQIVVAHSFGCLATVHAAAHRGARLAGALLVAPADPARFSIELAAIDDALPFPTTLVASTNDPWMKLTKAGALATAWGSRLLTMDGAGHINVDSGHGEWPQGLYALRDLAERAAAAGTARAPWRARSRARPAPADAATPVAA